MKDDITRAMKVTCPRCEQPGRLYEYTDPAILADNKFAGYVFHVQSRLCCMLRAKEVEQLMKGGKQDKF